MEPPPLARYITRNSKQRYMSAGSSLRIDPKDVEVMPSSSKKLKLSEVVPHDIIEIDGDECPDGVVIVDEEVDMSNKEKSMKRQYDKNWQKQVKDALANDLLDPTGAAVPGLVEALNPLKSFASHKSTDLNGFDPHLACYDDDHAVDDGADIIDHNYYLDCICEDDYLNLQTQFDYVGLPAGVEVTVPWLQIPALSKNKATASSSSFYSNLQNQFSFLPVPETSILSWKDRMKMKSAAASSSAYTSMQTQSSASQSCSTVPIVSLEEEEEEGGVLNKFQLFKQFDTVKDYSDHHYSGEGSSMMLPSKNWVKKIQEEWKILEKDLPDAIFVRVYEARMDLLRAVIVGAAGTPYHDGLFFFDVVFPFDYPNVPPKVYYHSGGLRLNPNLYDSGKVCLSLLNTWNGGKNEKWIPGKSTMLQVLVSIQALILNSKPFFNEPGYDSMYRGPEGERRSDQYNEGTFLKSLQTMLYTLRRPPKHFEVFVAGHFRKHAHDILVACKAYMDGAQVGCLAKGGVQDVDEGDKSCSKGFQGELACKLKLLVPEFRKNGSQDCEQFLSLVGKGINKVPDTKLKL